MDNNVLSQPQANYDDEIDLRELFGVLWAGKIKIIAITAVFAIAVMTKRRRLSLNRCTVNANR